jgi:hypothetical protein
MSMADVSDPLAVAAVFALIRKKKLSEDARLSDLFDAVAGDPAPKPLSASSGAEPPLTLGRLLESLDESGTKLDLGQHQALISLARANDASNKPVPAPDHELKLWLLRRVLETTTKKPANEAIASELGPALRLARGVAGEGSNTSAGPLVPLLASAPEVGRFFLRNQFDGRPLPARTKVKGGVLIGRQNSDLVLIKRHDDVLVVVMLTLPAEASTNLVDTLHASLDAAVGSLPPLPPSAGKRKSSPR